MSANDLYGKCGTCGHDFLVARLPMPFEKVLRLAKRAACAQCGETSAINVTSPRADIIVEEDGR